MFFQDSKIRGEGIGLKILEQLTLEFSNRLGFRPRVYHLVLLLALDVLRKLRVSIIGGRRAKCVVS